MENKIFFNFSYLALKLLGSGLYSNPWNAISELVANGFDAGANNVYIHIHAINKEHATVEIFDNGKGMSYQDLVEKYVFVGRNKRLDELDNDNIKTLGRKGIGKLATLYLSNNVQIITKTKIDVTAWSLNISDYNEDERPALIKSILEEIELLSIREWSNIKTGVLIKLNDVNLTGLGEKTLAGLKNRLSDFYLLDNNDRKILFSYNEKEEEKSYFEPIEKNVAYKNFYVLFNNSNSVFPEFENQRIKIQNKFPKILKDYPTQIIDSNAFVTSGTAKFITENQTEIEKKYEMKGWIGLHTTINQSNARENDPTFLKNRATSPNRLRLYVRGKLAIENFLDYIKSSQAFSNYIEGEISFDILDDNDLPDIATANRQQISEKDSRVQLLINIVNPIITKLIQTRVALAKKVRIDEELIEKKRIDEISIKHESELAQSEKEKMQIQKEKEQISAELGLRKQQIELLAKGLRKDETRLADAIHTIQKMCVTIDKKIIRVFKSFNQSKSMPLKFYKEISTIKLYNHESLIMTKYAFKGKYNLKSKIINQNIGLFIEQYINVMLETPIKTEIVFDPTEESKFFFDTTSLGIILENVYSNSEKAGSQTMKVQVDI
ncbi:MAG: hypothetical protein BGN88_13840, partial [Clostridiales bacterium 43-6]